MNKQAHFREYNPDQLYLLPPSMRDWLPEDDLAYFIMDVVNDLDLSAIYDGYDGSQGGQPPYDPRTMVSLLLYGYCVGIPSSRKIEQATYHSVPFRVLSADQHPDHDTIASFRQRHLKALSETFVQVLRLCQKAGLVKLGHVALDGTKIRANASKHKAMSYGRMEKKAAELEKEVVHLLQEAARVDAKEDALYGKGKRGDELPQELRFKESRLKKIKEAMRALEAEAKEKAAADVSMDAQKKRKRGGQKHKDRRRHDPPAKPDVKAQRNFTDPDSHIMKDGSTKSFEQSYNCQAAVDQKAQVIVATNVTQEANDKRQLKPVLAKLKENTGGSKPKKVSADSGYFSEENVNTLENDTIDAYVATGKERHSQTVLPARRGRIPGDATIKERMSRKLRTIKGRCTYSKRKQIVEPVFGQIKEARGFRRFLLRGLEKVHAEWDLICLTHNLLKLFRSGLKLTMA
ncbi:IS1182 family transposase [candidate division WOR-3 bacterium]|nr:IS1182 family transposase [candidate division WOR-3 bacterium]